MPRSVRCFLSGLLVVLGHTAGLAQFKITGRVLNQADTKPLPYCSVFLKNATIGDKTAADGIFALKNIRPGKYTMIFSIIGFEAYSQDVTISDADVTLSDVLMFPKTIALNEVTVKPDPYRERNYNWFKNDFLGGSALAKQCKILNPDDVYLSYDEKQGILSGSSTDFIEIENQALGYKVKYLLKEFTLDNKVENARKIHYEGSALFEEMKGSPAQQQRWQKRRLEVYQNSPEHFLRALLAGKTEAEGFRIMQLTGEGKSLRPVLYALSNNDILRPTDVPELTALTCDGSSIQVDYNKNHKFNQNGAANGESTVLTFKEPYMFFDANGGITNTAGVAFSGAWGRHRIAELLPVDFAMPENESSPAQIASVGNSNSAHDGPLNQALLKMAAISDSLNTNAAIEKIYLQSDKPYYTLNDTLWFKAYLLNTNYLMPTEKSGIMNVDILNDSSKIIKQYRFPVGQGLTWGNISLNDKDFTPGTYVLRAYTNWMRNQGANDFFYKQFSISNIGESSLLVNASSKLTTADGINKADVKLLFRDANKTAYAVKGLQVQLLAGSKRLYNQKMQTGVDGVLELNFQLPDKARNLKLIATSELKDRSAVVPLLLNRAENADIQFLPESGSLIGGFDNRISVKVIGEDGKGIDASGVVVNQEQKQVAVFGSLHNGMGGFTIPVKAGESYTAKVNLPGGAVRSIPLPAVKANGTALTIVNNIDADSIQVSIGATGDKAAAANNYFLLAQSRGIVCYAAVINFGTSDHLTRKIARNLFPTGIAHFVLTTATGEPLNERLAFIKQNDRLHIALNPDKAVYNTKDSVGVKIKITDAEGHPVTGSFSLAVTDDGQIKKDTADNENILTRFLLTSDLKGYVEQPGYYFSNAPGAWAALDNLLLTQGWITYDLDQPSKFEAEKTFEVNGSIVNVFNKPVKRSDVLLFSKSPTILKDTLTDDAGKFSFANFPRVDTPQFIVKAVYKRGKSFNVMVNIDEVKPLTAALPALPAIIPWYVNSDTTLLNYAKINALARQQLYFPGSGHILKEVKITAKKIIKDSQSLNGPGNADIVLDEKELEAQGKKTFLDVLSQKIKGFRTKYVLENNKVEPCYMVDSMPIFLVVDGYNFLEVYQPTDTLEEIKSYLVSHSAEDIKGIEVNITGKYAEKYYRRYCRDCAFLSVAFIEITTRAGHGPFITNTPGVYMYKPLPISWPKHFYKPKYLAKKDDVPDLRATIDWEPHVATDANGEATVWFYTAGIPSTYTMVMEGTDLSGNLGYSTKKISVTKK